MYITTSRVTTKENEKKKSVTNILRKKRGESYEYSVKTTRRNSLAVQWLGLCVFTAVSSIPWLGT